MKKIWVNKVNSFKEAEDFERDYYLDMSSSKRLETMQLLREIYFKINPSTTLRIDGERSRTINPSTTLRIDGERSRTINPSIRLKVDLKHSRRVKEGFKDEDRKRLRRVIKIVQ